MFFKKFPNMQIKNHQIIEQNKRFNQKIITETNSESNIVYTPYSEAYGVGFEDMERRVPNIDLIKQLVGWKPHRNLSKIISDISTEMKKNL